MLYYAHEMQRLAMMPARGFADGLRLMTKNPLNFWTYTPFGRMVNSAADVFEQMTRRYGKPEWGLETTEIDGREVDVSVEPMVQRTYCDLIHFKRDIARSDRKVLIVAPLSGHYATLLRGTVETFLPDHDVYVTDWRDCRYIPVSADRFNLSDYVDYIIDFLHYLGPNTHVVAVCQPSVPVLAAAAVMSGWGDLCVPASMTLIGGPVDTRKSPTAVNTLAQENGIEWYEKNVIATVPAPYPGAGRQVYPGFLQLTNFISMNLDRHMASLNELYEHLVEGDEEAAEHKRSFYEEYLAVMDLPAEFFLQTVKTVFQDHELPKGEMKARWQPVEPEKITKTAILCVEGELDDISGVGQTKATLDLTTSLAPEMKGYHLQKGAGHYGVFNGGKWRRFIAPKIKQFMADHDLDTRAKKKPAAKSAAKPVTKATDKTVAAEAGNGSAAAAKAPTKKAPAKRTAAAAKTAPAKSAAKAATAKAKTAKAPADPA